MSQWSTILPVVNPDESLPCSDSESSFKPPPLIPLPDHYLQEYHNSLSTAVTWENFEEKLIADGKNPEKMWMAYCRLYSKPERLVIRKKKRERSATAGERNRWKTKRVEEAAIQHLETHFKVMSDAVATTISAVLPRAPCEVHEPISENLDEEVYASPTLPVVLYGNKMAPRIPVNKENVQALILECHCMLPIDWTIYARGIQHVLVWDIDNCGLRCQNPLPKDLLIVAIYGSQFPSNGVTISKSSAASMCAQRLIFICGGSGKEMADGVGVLVAMELFSMTAVAKVAFVSKDMGFLNIVRNLRLRGLDCSLISGHLEDGDAVIQAFLKEKSALSE